jgi:hypothetical protein
MFLRWRQRRPHSERSSVHQVQYAGCLSRYRLSLNASRGTAPRGEQRRRQIAKDKAIRQLALQRVEAVWTCLDVLCPDLTPQAKKALAERVFELSRGEDQKPPRIQIPPSQVQDIVWRNMQCINPRCPMLLFSNQIADELNEFFKQEE